MSIYYSALHVAHYPVFKVYLPASSGKVIDEDEKAVPLKDLQGRKERILLVEDEKIVREFATRILRENGYIVLDAVNAKEAMDIFEKEGREFDLVFSDIVLPDKNGLQLVDQILFCKPDLSVMLGSGYAGDKSQWDTISERKFHFIQKPYNLFELLQATKETIERKYHKS